MIHIQVVTEIHPGHNNNAKKIKDDPYSSSSPDRAYKVLVLDDGSIMLIGSCKKTDINKNKICVAKFNADGSVNTSFGTNGFEFYNISSGADNAYTATLYNNKIYIGGTCSSQFCVLRLNLDGSLDDSFGLPSGSVRTGYIYKDILGNGFEEGNSIYVSNDGIYIGTRCDNRFCVAKFLSDGSDFDTNFGTNGYQIFDPTGNLEFGKSLIIHNNKIVIGGYFFLGTTDNKFGLAKFDMDGSVDWGFGDGGYKIIDIPGTNIDVAQALLIHNDKYLLSGFCGNDTSSRKFCIARIDLDGSFDETFNSTGYNILDIPESTSEFIESMLIQNDNKIVVGGMCTQNTGFDFCLARFNDNGTLDTSFNNPNGYIITNITIWSDYLKSIAIQIHNNIYKIIAGGYCSINGSDDHFCLARFK